MAKLKRGCDSRGCTLAGGLMSPLFGPQHHGSPYRAYSTCTQTDINGDQYYHSSQSFYSLIIVSKVIFIDDPFRISIKTPLQKSGTRALTPSLLRPQTSCPTSIPSIPTKQSLLIPKTSPLILSPPASQNHYSCTNQTFPIPIRRIHPTCKRLSPSRPSFTRIHPPRGATKRNAPLSAY